MVEKILIRKNLASKIEEKKLLKFKEKLQRELNKSIDKKPLYLKKTTEKNQKIVNMHNLLALGDILRKSKMY